MYLHLIVLCPLLLFLCVYVVFVVRENLKNLELENEIEIHDSVLDKSGQKNRKTKKYHVPKFMLELYEKNKWIDRSTVTPDVVRSLIPKHAGSLYNKEVFEKLTDKHLLIFDLPVSPVDEKFVSAELKILTLVSINSKEELGVKRIIKISTYDDLMNKLSNTQEIEIQHFNDSWLSFDLTSSVSKILQKENRHLKVILTISAYFSNFKNTLKLSLMPLLAENLKHDYPALLLSYSSNQQLNTSRKKRSLDMEDYEEDTNKIWDDEYSKKLSKKLKRIRNSCKRKPLYIDFEEIDYDIFIVQPKGYEAFQCQGKCYYPVAEHLNPTKHAIFQALLHSVAPGKATRSCCVPTALDSISILYVDEKGVLTYRYAYKDMVVTECGCR